MQSTQHTNIILVVDDELISRLVMSKMIESQGFIVETASNGEEALSMWQKKRYSLIFTDCRMPKMDGFCLSKTIRHIEEAEQATPSNIIALTANESSSEQHRCQQAGMNDCLTKPMTSNQLKTILSSHLYVTQETIDEHATEADVATQLIDYTILEGIFPDKIKQTEVLQDFQSHLRKNYDVLKVQIEKSDLDNIENTAHQMKGACKMVGVNGIAHVCAKIESMAKGGRIADHLLLSNLSSRIQQFNTHLRQQLNAVNLTLAATENR